MIGLSYFTCLTRQLLCTKITLRGHQCFTNIFVFFLYHYYNGGSLLQWGGGGVDVVESQVNYVKIRDCKVWYVRKTCGIDLERLASVGGTGE